MQKKHWFLQDEKTLVPCELVRESVHARMIEVKEKALVEGVEQEEVKVIKVHPQGVAFGRLYPRLFTSMTPDMPKVSVFHHRALVHQNDCVEGKNAVPKINEHYRFQPFIADVIDAIHQKQNIILTGGTGVGKTTHITQLAGRINQPMLRVNFNGETRMSDLIGKVHVSHGSTQWMDGILPMAMRKGWWLLLDELDFAEPAVLSLLHPVLEEESMLVLKENNGEIIVPHPNFRIFATANSIGAMSERSGSYHGTQPMNEAFLDRWQVIFVDNLPLKEEIAVLRKEAPGLNATWAKRIAMFAAKVRNASGDNEFEYSGDNFSTRKSIAWAKKTALHRDPVKGAQLAWMGKLPLSEQESMKRVIQTFFGGGRGSRGGEGVKTQKQASASKKTLAKTSFKSVKVKIGKALKTKLTA